MVEKIIEFLATNPTDEQGETFCINEILPFDKRSMLEILQEDCEVV